MRLSLRIGSMFASTSSRTADEPRPSVQQIAVDERLERGRRWKHRHVHRFLAAARQEPPELVGRERQDRRHQPRQAVGHQVQRRLRRPTLPRVRRQRVHPILRHVVVERAQVHRRERVERVEDRAVLVVVVSAEDPQPHLTVAREDVAIHFLELPGRHEVHGGIEVVQVPEQIPHRVADLPVGLDDARQDLLAEPYFLRVVAHRHPETQDVGAALLDDVLRLDRVAERLGHLASVLGHDEAVREHLAERRAAARAEADHQRALEPAAMLVAPFEIDVRRPRQLGTHRKHRLVARPGIEPDVEDVHLALERRAAAGRARQAVGDEFFRRPLVPRVGAVLLEDRGRLVDERRRDDRLAALHAVDRRDRHAPHALTRDAPVRPVRDHVVHAVVAPRGDPLHVVVDRVERGLPKSLPLAVRPHPG